VQTILSNFGKKIKFLQPSHIERGQGTAFRGEVSPFPPAPCSPAFSPLPALVRKDAHLIWHVNDNEKIMQLDDPADNKLEIFSKQKYKILTWRIGLLLLLKC